MPPAYVTELNGLRAKEDVPSVLFYHHYATQIPGTANLRKRCGDADVLSG